jgi:hypothetical protein
MGSQRAYDMNKRGRKVALRWDSTELGPPSEQNHQKDDQQDQTEATTIVMVRRSIIESTPAEQQNQNDQENDQSHRFSSCGRPRGQSLTVVSFDGYDKRLPSQQLSVPRTTA